MKNLEKKNFDEAERTAVVMRRKEYTNLLNKRADFDEFLPFKIRYFRWKGNGIIILCIDNQLVTLNDCTQAFRRSGVQLAFCLFQFTLLSI